MGAADDLLPSPPPTKRCRRRFNLLLPCLILTLATSLSLNVLFGAVILHARRNRYEMSTGWSREAAEEAERVAAIACSGHGSAFLDGASDDGNSTVCECFGCFTGPDCSRLSTEGCVADADSGNPLFLEPFWRKHASSSAVMVSGWHRMGYSFDGGSLISVQLQKQILEVHAVAGNAVTNGKFIVFGPGSTELLNAAVHALSSLMISNQSSTVKVVASFPYYPIYKSQTDYFKSNLFDFHGDASLWKNNSDKFIEFVTSPNNPDCQLNKAVLKGPSVKTIHDYAYYWPHFTAIPSPADEDVMIFTLSKLTGHAGSRFGWALIKDEALYEKMKEYVRYNILVLSHETQLRALKLLKVAVEKGEGREIFEFGHGKMRDRWQRLNQVMSKTQRFSLQQIPPQFCNFFQRIREASPAYAWLRCNREEDSDCFAVLESAGIKGRAGSLFGGGEGEQYVRLSLLKSHDDFELLIAQIEKLVSVSADEDGSKTITDNSSKFIEFVTSPNNPDCQLNKAVLKGPSVKIIHDYAYYWPHFTAIPSPADEDVVIFTLSKITGHAGSRLGWALIKDEAKYEKVKEYVEDNILVLSHETQLRALKLLKVVLEKGEGREIFEFAHGQMRDRWQRMNRVLSKTQRFSLQHIPPQFCTFFQQIREASPAYAWLRCNKVEDTDCYAVLKSAGIIGRAGSLFGEGEQGKSYVRLSLMNSNDDFEVLIAQMEKFVSLSAHEHG